MARILVVDDMAVFREPIALALQQQGFNTLCASNGEEALRMLNSEGADVVLLDVAMPVMDGLRFLEILRRNPMHKDLPVVLLTAAAERDYVIRAARFGVKDYLLKGSFSLGELSNRLKHYFGQPAGGQDTTRLPAAVGQETLSNNSAVAQAAQPSALSADKPKAPPPRSLKEINPMIRQSQIEARLETAGELKALSPTVKHIMQLTASKNCSLEQLVKTIKQDHAISLKILKLANSAVYSRGDPVDRLDKAVIRIGLAQIRQVVLNVAVIDNFSSDYAHVAPWLNPLLFWEHCIATGLLAARITRTLGGNEEEVDAAFTAGLLHDVGRMVFIEEFSELYAEVLKTADSLTVPLDQVEKRVMLVNHTDIMDKLLHRWQFAKHLIDPIALHHLSLANTRNIARSSFKQVSVVALANRLAHAMVIGSSGNEFVYQTHEFAQALELNGDNMDHILDGIVDETDDLKLAMLQNASPQAWPDRRKYWHDQIGTPLSVLFVGPNAGTDSYRMFAQAISSAARGDDPNLIITYATSNTARKDITDQIHRLEKERKIGPLPVIIVSSRGTMGALESDTNKRRLYLLPSPMPIKSFCQAAKMLLQRTD